MSSPRPAVMASERHVVARNSKQRRTVEAFCAAPSLQPLIVGHMCKQDKGGHSFSKRYFALYQGGLLVYYTHQRDFERDVKKHKGTPLRCTLVTLEGLYLSRPKAFYSGIKHCFTLHAPNSSNHRQEFLLVCQTKKDMRIWVEQLQSQNSSLAQGEKPHKTPCYIQKLRLSVSHSLQPMSRPSARELDATLLSHRASYCPGDIALSFHTNCLSGSNSSTETEV